MQWVWSRVVQAAVSDWVEDRNSEPIRLQHDVMLPTGGRPDDFYESPENWEGFDCIIPIPEDLIDALIAEFTPPDLFTFGRDEVEEHCQAVHTELLHSMVLTIGNAWDVVCHMIALLPAQ